MIQNSFEIIYSDEAQEDLLDAVKWYNKQKKGLGKKIKADVKNIENLITANPTFASVKYKSIRTAACKVFPYALHYEIDPANKIIRILSIFHFSRKPKEPE